MLEDFNFFDKRESRKIIDTRIPERNRKTKQADSSSGGGGGRCWECGRVLERWSKRDGQGQQCGDCKGSGGV